LRSAYTIKITWSNFIPYTQGTSANVPDAPGVYEFWVGLKGEGKRRIYVGKADNLSERYLHHLSDEEENECLKNNLKKYVWYYRYAIIKIKADREDAELGLYRKYKYECNIVEPPGSGRKNFTILEDP